MVLLSKAQQKTLVLAGIVGQVSECKAMFLVQTDFCPYGIISANNRETLCFQGLPGFCVTNVLRVQPRERKIYFRSSMAAFSSSRVL